jgi:hypothetical protein
MGQLTFVPLMDIQDDPQAIVARICEVAAEEEDEEQDSE